MKLGIWFASVRVDYVFTIAARSYFPNGFKSTEGRSLRFTGTRARKAWSASFAAIRANVKDNRPEPH